MNYFLSGQESFGFIIRWDEKDCDSNTGLYRYVL